MKTKKDIEIKEGIALSFAACFMLFLYAPLETYFTNVNEFWFDVYLLLIPFCVVFLCFFGMSILILYFLKKKYSRIYPYFLLTYFVVFICTYIQGNFLVQSLPILNGAWIEWADYPMERIKCIIVWVFVSGIVGVVYKLVKKDKIFLGIKIICICMSLMFLVTLLTLALTNNGMKRKESVCATTRNLLTVSEDCNYLILVLDGLNSYDFNKMRDTHSEWEKMFTDFTYYQDTFGVYPSTRYTVPFLFSGEWYNKAEAYADYSVRAYTESPVLEEFEKEDYQIGIYITDSMMPQSEKMTKFDNVISNRRGVNNWWAFVRWNMQIVGFKYAPFDLKRICFVDPGAFEGLKILPEGYMPHTGKNSDFYQIIRDEQIVKVPNKVFKYMHIDGAHPPFRYDENVSEINNATYSSSIEASMTITNAFLEKLRESEIYDNSVIIVMADHGWDTGENDDGALRWQTPILLIKGKNEKHEFQISQAPISYVDMQDAFIKLLDGNLGESVFEWKENDKRERTLVFDNGENESSKTNIVVQTQTGKAWDSDTLIVEEKSYD